MASTRLTMRSASSSIVSRSAARSAWTFAWRRCCRASSEYVPCFQRARLRSSPSGAFAAGSKPLIAFTTNPGRTVPFQQALTSNFGAPGTIRRSSQSGTFVGGGGIEIPLGTRFVIAPEVRLFMCQPKDDFAPWAAIRGGVSAGWRF